MYPLATLRRPSWPYTFHGPYTPNPPRIFACQLHEKEMPLQTTQAWLTACADEQNRETAERPLRTTAFRRKCLGFHVTLGEDTGALGEWREDHRYYDKSLYTCMEYLGIAIICYKGQARIHIRASEFRVEAPPCNM